MKKEPLEIFVAKYALGLHFDAYDLPEMAMQWLEAGHDTPALWELMSLQDPTREEAIPILEKFLREVGVVLPQPRNVALRFSREVAELIVNSSVTPYEGARRIWIFANHAGIENVIELHPFIYAASEWEDRPADREVFDNAIIEAAKMLLNQDQQTG